MNLRLIREPSVGLATHGVLFGDGHFLCFTLEDLIREVPGVPVATWKVKGETAIPADTYPVQLTLSARFGVVLPLIAGVPGFSGIRMHAGNTRLDTEGCLLVGLDRQQGRVLKSRVALAAVLARLEADDRPHTIRIENPEVS